MNKWLIETLLLKQAGPGTFVLAGALFVFGCFGNSAAAAPAGQLWGQQSAPLEQDGKLPTLDRSDSIAGPDTDRNGVRDDIDAYLMQRFPDVRQRAAAMQMAKAMQQAVLAGAGSSRDAIRDADRKINNAIHCLYTRFHGAEGTNTPSAVGDEIEAITSNTKPRLLAYLAYDKSLDGTTSTLPRGNTCE